MTNTGKMIAMVGLLLASTQVVQSANQALIIGGFNPEQDSIETHGVRRARNEVWNDCYLAFEQLDTTLYGHLMELGTIPPERIHFLFADLDTGDWRGRTWRYRSWDQLGITHITDTTAYLDNIKRYLNALAYGDQELGIQAMDPVHDTLFVFVFSHGGASNVNPYIANFNYFHVQPFVPGQGGVPVWDTTFGPLMKRIHANKKVVVMFSCFSGGFVSDLVDSATTIVASARAYAPSQTADNKRRLRFPESDTLENEPDNLTGQVQYHGEFNFHFFNALRGARLWPYGSPDTALADTNGDSRVSWGEAFNYVQQKDNQDHPVYSDFDMRGWKQAPDVPAGLRGKRVKDGGSLAAFMPDSAHRDSVAISIYALKGNGRCEFYNYVLDSSQWYAKESIPAVGSSGKRKAVKAGGTLCANGSKVYATKGNNTLEFWEYDPYAIGAYPWRQLSDVPAGAKLVKDGAGAVVVPICDTDYVYLLKGNGTCEFYRFNTVSGVWQTLAPAPIGMSGKGFKKGSCLAFDNCSTIYALKGSKNEFYAYNVNANAWATKSTLPLEGRRAGAGACAAFSGSMLYALKGNGRNDFWSFSPVGDWGLWAQRDPIPTGAGYSKTVKAGAALVSLDGVLWALKGNSSLEFWKRLPYGVDDMPIPNSPPPSPDPNELPIAGGNASVPRWNVAGDSVVYCRPTYAIGPNQVFKSSHQSGTETQVTSLSADCGHPVWSLDGTRIAFECNDANGFSQIAVVPSAGGQVSVLTSDSVDHESPEWIPGGGIIYQREDSTGYVQLYAVPDTGGDEQALTNSSVDHELPRPLSANQTVYQREGDDDNQHIYRLIRTPAMTQEVPLTTLPYDHENPAVAQTSGAVTFQVFPTSTTSPDVYSQVGVAIPDVSQEQILTSGQSDFETPSITADGNAIHCIRRGDPGAAVCFVYPDGSGWYQITDDDAERDHPSSTVNATCGLIAAFEREDCVFRTSNGGGGGGQSSGITPVTLTSILPNPAKGQLRIAWNLPRQTNVRLRIYDATGRSVRTLKNGTTRPGSYVTVWNRTDDQGRRLGAGVYFLTLETKDTKLNRKVVLTD
jgi:hypothetical protein